MTTISLGVLDQPYGSAPTKSGKTPAARTTGQVAGYLEDKYHVMEVFYELRVDEIADAMAGSIGDALANVMSGVPPQPNPFHAAEVDIRTMFQEFIDRKEMDGLGVPSVPTKASLRGVNHRMLHPYAKRGPRPSFKDTGTYEASFWVGIE